MEIAGKLYDEIVANVPGAIIQTSVGEPGEMSSPDQAKLISFKVQDLIISEKRYGTSNSILMIFCISPSFSLWVLSSKTLINLCIMDSPFRPCRLLERFSKR